MQINDETASAALEELKATLTAENPVFAARCEVQSHDLIESYKKHGDSGKVFLLYLALSISAASERDEI